MITSEELKMLSEIDIRTINKSDLTNLKDISIADLNNDRPVNDRIKDFIEQIGNPYCYIDHGMIVKICFTGKKRIEECMKECAFC